MACFQMHTYLKNSTRNLNGPNSNQTAIFVQVTTRTLAKQFILTEFSQEYYLMLANFKQNL
jgi:hypothetical protein